MATRRRIFIGDIQGCRRELVTLLERCDLRHGTDRVLPVGDLVNKGPDSEGVLRVLKDLDAESVLGNHDLWWLAKQRWKDPALRSWLAAQPVVRVHDDVIQVHAGLNPTWTEAKLRGPLTAAEVEYATNIRYCLPDGTPAPEDWPPPAPPYQPWDEFWLGKPVVCGHWARRGLVQNPRCTSLDTGCCYGGRLTAWIPEDRRIVQVDALDPRR